MDFFTGDNFMVLLGKILLIVIMAIYCLVSILIFRQVWLMNKAIRTKLSGLINCIAIVHLFFSAILLFFAFFV